MGKIDIQFEEYGFDERDTGSVIKRQVRKNPDRPSLIFKDRIISYGELDETTDRIANGLRAIGVQRNENVGVMLNNCPEFAFSWIALNKIGAIEYPFNPLYSGDLLKYYINYSDVHHLIVAEDFMEQIAAIQKELTKVKHVIVVPSENIFGSKPVKLDFIVSLFEELTRFPATPGEEKLNYWNTSLIVNTGGTTGPAKGVVLSYNRQYTMARNLSLHMGWGADTRYYCCWPFYHNLAQGMICLAAFIHGGSTVIAEKFSPSIFWDDIRKYECNALYFTGTAMPLLLKQPPKKSDGEHNVRRMFSYPRLAGLTEDFEKRFNTELIELYGMTESNINMMLPLDDRRKGSCGVVLPDNEVYIMDEHDMEVPVGEIGEIVVRPKEPYWICSGYYNRPDADAKALRNCYWHTGDFGYRDKDGFFYFVDRALDAIRKSGERISSLDIESTVNAHPGVKECAAIAVPSEFTGNEILLSIVTKENHVVDPRELVEYMDSKLPYFMVPRYFRFIKSLPKSHTSRIQKFVLRQQGITADTWDRIKAGCRLKREQNRERKYKMKLFEPIEICNMKLRNRIVFPPMGTLLANKDGSVSEAQISYYARRAKGGAGLVTVEATGIGPEGVGLFAELKICNDSYIKGLSALTKAVKSHGAKIGIQIYHPGRQAASSRITSVQPVAPSAIPYVKGRTEVPRELTVEEIEGLAEEFSEGARRAKEAGFDMVEIHAAHGYLVAQFLSPLSNHRMDGYGGDVQGRSRFAVEVVRRTRQKVGPDFPIFCRISGDEFEEGGLKISDSVAISKILIEAGVDVIDVSAGTRNMIQWMIQPMTLKRGCIVHLAEEIKKNVNVPVITAGRINNPELAESILSEGKADLVSIGRGMLADPDFPIKAREGNFDDIRKCTGCNTCADKEFEFTHIQCAINPEAGNEGSYRLSPATSKKKVLVVGGGPGGLKAAEVLAERGHEVVLYEKEAKIGGQLNQAGAPSGKAEFRTIMEYFGKRLENLQVKVLLGKEATLETVELEKPDEVVVCAGAIPTVPPIPGIDMDHVYDVNTVFEQDVVKMKENIIVVGGGGTGCDIALYLAKAGKKVTIMEILDRVGQDLGRINRWVNERALKDANVILLTAARMERITGSSVIYTQEGKTKEMPVDANIIIATGMRPNRGLIDQLTDMKVKVHVVGDCIKPRKVLDAVHEGFEVASRI